MADLWSAAAKYAALGYPPVRCAAGAKAANTEHGKDDATLDLDEIRRVFSVPHNVGILPPAGVLVLDVDVAKDDRPVEERQAEARARAAELERDYPELRRAPRARSARGGYHLITRLPEGVTLGSRTKAIPGVDLRGEGRTYIVAAPSVTPDGAYAWERPLVRPEDLPLAGDALIGLLERPEPASTREEAEELGVPFAGDLTDRKEIGDPREFARGLLAGTSARLSSVGEGGRHNATLEQARVLGRWTAGYALAGHEGLSERDARAVLEDATERNGYARESTCSSTITDGFRYGFARPFEVVVKTWEGPSQKIHIATSEPEKPISSDGDREYLETTYLAELDRRHERPWSAYPTGLRKVDLLLDGGYHEGLHVVAGLTGGGKTSFALRLAYRNALEARHVIYASYEQSKHELWSRVTAHATRLPYSALKRGTYVDYLVDERSPASYVLQQKRGWRDVLEASEYLHVLEAGDALSRQESGYTIEALQKLAARLKEKSGVPPLLVVDYLQRMPAKELASREIRERVGYVAGLLQVAVARELGSPVVALSSLNRASYKQNARGVTNEDRLASLKESGEVEYSAYTVAVLYPPAEGKEPNTMLPTVESRGLHFDLAKNREGRTGKVDLRWTPVGDRWEEALA